MDRSAEPAKRLSPALTLGEGPVPPTLAAVAAAAQRIGPHILRTPVVPWRGATARRLFGEDTEIWLKLELFQTGGSFKVRGALNSALQLSAAELTPGLTAFSSGNHAIAVAYAAEVLGVSAKVVMLSSANAARVAACRSFGAEIVFAASGEAAMQMVREIQLQEGRAAIHPYDGVHISEGTGTISLEVAEQVPDLDAVLVSVGGGGLCSGLACTMKQLRPACRIYAVEPEGADTMYRSFETGLPQSLDAVATIADCLAPPQTLPYSLGLCRQSVDELALVSDAAMVQAMGLLFSQFKVAVEPGGAASTAAALGPFRDRIAGKKALILLCGSNIDVATFSQIMRA